MKALYYEGENVWVVEDEGTEVDKITLQDTPADTISFWAQQEGKLERTEGDFEWDDLKEQDRSKLLDWFSQEIFPTKEYGKYLITSKEKDIGEEMFEEKEDDVEVEDTALSYKDLRGKQEEDLVETTKEETLSTITNVFRVYEKDGALDWVFGGLKNEDEFAWDKFSKDAGMNISDENRYGFIPHLKKAFYQVKTESVIEPKKYASPVDDETLEMVSMKMFNMSYEDLAATDPERAIEVEDAAGVNSGADRKVSPDGSQDKMLPFTNETNASKKTGYRSLVAATDNLITRLTTECLKTVDGDSISSEQIDSVLKNYANDIMADVAVELQEKLLQKGVQVMPYSAGEMQKEQQPDVAVGEGEETEKTEQEE